MASGYRNLDWWVAAAQGLIDGSSVVHKYGRNTDIDSAAEEDIWDGGGTWTAPTQARVHTLVSTSDVDGKTGAPASAGARTVRLYGLTDWNSEEISEDVVLNGITGVNTVNSYVIIHRMQVLTMGASGPNAGTITATAVTDGTVTAQIGIGNGQTLMCVYGVPSTKTAYIHNHYGSLHKVSGAGSNADILLYVNSQPDVELVGGYLLKNVIGGALTGTNFAEYTHKAPEVYPGPCIIKLAASVSANDTDISGGFDMVLKDNT
jgi:hypothetical protein